MALISCDFHSESLGLATSMTVILPQKTSASQIGLAGSGGEGDAPVLYLLHGLSDDHTIWLRRTSIERYVAPLGIAVVMPAVHRSFYNDMARGMKFWTFVSEELPAIVQSFFHVSKRPEDTFVAGLSMGGFGAFKLAFSHPERFAAAAALSGVMDAKNLYERWSGSAECDLIFGGYDKIPNSPNDLFFMAEKLAKSKGQIPKLFMSCGTEDFLYEDNLRMKAHLESLKLPLTYTERPGTHEWGYWDAEIQKVLAWLPLKKAS